MSVMQAPASEQYRDSLKWPQYRKPTHEEWNAEVTALRTELAAIKAAQPEPMSDERINELWAWSGEPEAERTATTRHHAFAYALLSAQPDGWVSEWQPIETAPREGKWVLLWWPYVVNRPMVGYCIVSKWYAAPSASEWGNNPPTHWMPLPAAPKEAR